MIDYFKNNFITYNLTNIYVIRLHSIYIEDMQTFLYSL